MTLDSKNSIHERDLMGIETQCQKRGVGYLGGLSIQNGEPRSTATLTCFVFNDVFWEGTMNFHQMGHNGHRWNCLDVYFTDIAV